ncbi:DUF2141 domain-containing protein [Halofilum ochraceum]|uniref:DUF2141 domain-containing protein n=1 Tax=Halofilum ochraceum TaxID=1611323 RepID=UPI0008D8FBC1|nr:DUF2141 domain-containing protein [Halofilum ochraceum]
MRPSETPDTRARLRRLFLATNVLAVSVIGPVAAAEEPPAPTIHVAIEGIRDDAGRIACAFFRSGDGFPVASPPSPAVIVTATIRNHGAVCMFRDVPPGTYAIAAMHDENRNGQLDRNWLGIPTEGYGFSENASASLGAPSFRRASFAFDGSELFLTISLQY